MVNLADETLALQECYKYGIWCEIIWNYREGNKGVKMLRINDKKIIRVGKTIEQVEKTDILSIY